MSMNARRIIAYIFDFLTISLIANAIAISPLNPNFNAVTDLQEEYETVTQDYLNVISELSEEEEDEEALKIVTSEYKEAAEFYSQEITKKSIYSVAISITIIILYFVIFAYFFDGQTVGKRLMKIRITNIETKRPNIGQLLIRTIIVFEIPFSIISIICSFILGKKDFYTANMVLFYLKFIFELVLLFTTLTRQDHRGIHDLIAKTKVEMDKPKIEKE